MTNYILDTNIRDEVLSLLLSSPSPQAIVAFHASEEAQERLRYLLDANRAESLTDAERAELDEASQLNHIITLLKARARNKT